MKTGTRVRSPKPPFYETALLSPSDFAVDFLVDFFLPFFPGKGLKESTNPKDPSVLFLVRGPIL